MDKQLTPSERANLFKEDLLAKETQIASLERQRAEMTIKANNFEEICKKQKKEMAEMEAAFDALKTRYYSQKEQNEELQKAKATNDLLRAQLVKATEKNTELATAYQKLIDHSQEKIGAANTEIAKLSKSSLGSIEANTGRNKQLKIKNTMLEKKLQIQSDELAHVRSTVSQLLVEMDKENID